MIASFIANEAVGETTPHAKCEVDLQQPHRIHSGVTKVGVTGEVTDGVTLFSLNCLVIVLKSECRPNNFCDRPTTRTLSAYPGDR